MFHCTLDPCCCSTPIRLHLLCNSETCQACQPVKTLSSPRENAGNLVCCPMLHRFPAAAEGPGNEWILQRGWMQISSHRHTYRRGHTHTKRKHGTCGQRVFRNTVASSPPMHNAWEHVNTLFRTCINDHGEAHSLSTRAINKRWCTDKGPYLPPSWKPPAHPTLPLDPPRHTSCQFLTLFYFCAAWGCGTSGVELNNEWRLSECPATEDGLLHRRCSKDSRTDASTHANNCCGPHCVLKGGKEGLNGLWGAGKKRTS